MSAPSFSGVAMVVVERPSHSPHRMFLRTCALAGGAGVDVYHVQERKSGAARGLFPRWAGFDEADAALMREVARRWNEHERLEADNKRLRDALEAVMKEATYIRRCNELARNLPDEESPAFRTARAALAPKVQP